MATDDRQVLVVGAQAAPTHFTIPGSGQIQPKTIYAFFDGTAAGSVFNPTLKIMSDGGELIGIYTTGQSVAAGGSANVTWFPDGELDTGGSSGGTSGVQSISAGDSSIVVAGDAVNTTVETGSLNLIAADHPPVADWSNNSHKITGVTAGAATGEVAIYDQTPAGIVTAKGDLLVGTGSHVAAALPVGADTYILTADSAQTDGVKWAAAGGGTGTISDITSTGSTITVSSPTGPTTNVDLPNSGVTAATYGSAANVPQIAVDAQGRITAASNVSIGGGVVVGADGWVDDTTETWTYASFTAGPPAVGTFTIAGDLRTKYSLGTRIKLTQTTVKYFVVQAASTYDGANTTVSVTGGTDYTLANAAISANYSSYVLNPVGYPGWFTFAPGLGGFSPAATINEASFDLNGRSLSMELNVSGTSNATTFTMSGPVASAFANVILARTSDNGQAPIVGQLNTATGSTSWAFRNGVGAGSGSFTNSGNKAGIAVITIRV